MTTRSLQIAKGSTNTTGAFVVVYTVPADHVLILKGWVLQNWGATNVTCAIANGDPLAAGITISGSTVAGAGGVAEGIGRFIVFKAGETVQVYRASGTNDLRYLISGALLPV